MNTRKAYTNVVKVAMGIVFFLSAMSMACDEGPSPDNAYGITSPVTQVEQAVIDAVSPDAQNTLSGGN